jgi:hypothetical protein
MIISTTQLKTHSFEKGIKGYKKKQHEREYLEDFLSQTSMILDVCPNVKGYNVKHNNHVRKLKTW